jgi:ArsR family transcriptional regulator
MLFVKTPNSVEPEQLFKTLSDSTRLRLLNLLAEGEVCVCDLHGTLGLDQPKVSRHLAQLRRAGLVEVKRDGKWMHYRLARHGDPLARNVLEGLRAWMRQRPRLNSERGRLDRVCCQNDKTKGRQRKTS